MLLSDCVAHCKCYWNILLTVVVNLFFIQVHNYCCQHINKLPGGFSKMSGGWLGVLSVYHFYHFLTEWFLWEKVWSTGTINVWSSKPISNMNRLMPKCCKCRGTLLSCLYNRCLTQRNEMNKGLKQMNTYHQVWKEASIKYTCKVHDSINISMH